MRLTLTPSAPTTNVCLLSLYTAAAVIVRRDAWREMNPSETPSHIEEVEERTHTARKVLIPLISVHFLSEVPHPQRVRCAQRSPATLPRPSKKCESSQCRLA